MNEKAVLLSIQPRWCGLIAIGKKTIEVRKTRPKIETPFLCYIYECGNNGRKKIIGEFVCDEITRIVECCDVHNELPSRPCEYYLDYDGDDDILAMACLSDNEIWNYIGKEGVGYAWHISNLKIYKKPKELSLFVKPCSHNCENCKYYCTSSLEEPAYCEWEDCEISKPPQSWCYVEVSESEQTHLRRQHAEKLDKGRAYSPDTHTGAQCCGWRGTP